MRTRAAHVTPPPPAVGRAWSSVDLRRELGLVVTKRSTPPVRSRPLGSTRVTKRAALAAASRLGLGVGSGATWTVLCRKGE